MLASPLSPGLSAHCPGPRAVTLRVILDPRCRQLVYGVFISTPFAFETKEFPPIGRKQQLEQLEELRPSLASCLPAADGDADLLQLTPETSFPCCGSWCWPLGALLATPQAGLSGERGIGANKSRQIILPELLQVCTLE